MPHFHIITLFPNMFPGTLGDSLPKKALDKGIWHLNIVDLRQFGEGIHQQVDDTPYGGGAGMVLRPDILAKSLDSVIAPLEEPPLIVAMSPRGRHFQQSDALEFTKEKNIVIVCGRFEAIDERVLQSYPIQEISIGDFVLFGGEVAAMAVMESTVRLLPNVLGSTETLQEESFGLEGDYKHLLEYPHFTRPAKWRDQSVPDVLLSGNHQAIEKWRLDQAKAITKLRRKDLWSQHEAALRTYGKQTSDE